MVREIDGITNSCIKIERLGIEVIKTELARQMFKPPQSSVLSLAIWEYIAYNARSGIYEAVRN